MTENKTRAELLVQSRWFLLAVTLVSLLVGAVVWWLLDLSVPSIGRELKLFALAYGVAAVLGTPIATRLVDWLYTPQKKYLVEFDAATDEFALWPIPQSQFRELQVNEELHQLNASEPVYHCSSYDVDEHLAEGHWRGSASDLELVEHREAVKEVRGDLEDLAREGLSIRAKQSSIVRGSVKDIVMEFVADFEEESTYSGEDIQNRVDEALRDLDDDPDSEDSDDDQEGSPLIEAFASSTEQPDSPDDLNKNGNN